MSRSIKCDRCGVENAMTGLVLSQYNTVKVMTSGMGGGGTEYDVCGPCKVIITDVIESDVNYPREWKQLETLIIAAGGAIGTGLNAMPLAVADIIRDRDGLTKRVLELEQQQAERVAEVQSEHGDVDPDEPDTVTFKLDHSPQTDIPHDRAYLNQDNDL